MEGGNPLATLTWEDCPDMVSNTGSNSTAAWNRVSGRVTKDLNGRRCRCRASHRTWNSQTKTAETQVFTVFCKKPKSTQKGVSLHPIMLNVIVYKIEIMLYFRPSWIPHPDIKPGCLDRKPYLYSHLYLITRKSSKHLHLVT